MITLRWAELLLIYIGVPMVLAVFLPPQALYPVLGAGALLGAVLLHFTYDFRWAELKGPMSVQSALMLGVFTFLIASAVCWLILPDRFWFLLLREPVVLLIVAIAYPIILVVPQELVYRALYFKRYGPLFMNQKTSILVNAGLFSFGHLMYWHWIVWAATFVGSIIFSIAYLRPSGFPQAVLLHSVAGVAIFASGLGWLFYSGGAVSQ